MTAIKRVRHPAAFKGYATVGVDARLPRRRRPDRDSRGALAIDLGNRRDVSCVGYQRRRGSVLASSTRSSSVGERRDTGRRDRGARRGTAGRRDHVGGVPDVVDESETASWSRSATSKLSQTDARATRRDPELRRGWARLGRERVCRASVERLVDDIDEPYRELLTARGGLPPSGCGAPLQATSQEDRPPGRAAYPALVARCSKAANDGFFTPLYVIRPDCQPERFGSSLSRNQSIMSIRGFFRAIPNACVR